MKAMILAAGRGNRMRPLTDTVPKPLLEVRGRPMIEWTIEWLARGGISDRRATQPASRSNEASRSNCALRGPGTAPAPTSDASSTAAFVATCTNLKS